MALTHAELKSALWDAANTLRGSAVDRTDWKGYILPLLFFINSGSISQRRGAVLYRNDNC